MVYSLGGAGYPRGGDFPHLAELSLRVGLSLCVGLRNGVRLPKRAGSSLPMRDSGFVRHFGDRSSLDYLCISDY